MSRSRLLLSAPPPYLLAVPFTTLLALPLPAQEPPPAHPGHRHDEPPGDPDLARSGPFRLLEVSLDVMAAAGTSTERDAELERLQGGDHDPRKRGFTLQEVELAVLGAVDSWCTAAVYVGAHVDPFDGETEVHLEEAFVLSEGLPAGLQVKAGYFFTGFGWQNPRHPHEWAFLDQPVVATRLLGPDGMAGAGVRVGWRPFAGRGCEVQFGVQDANGETMSSFLANDEFYGERPIGGRFFTDREVRAPEDLLWSSRLATSRDLGGCTSLAAGASVAYGPNATGSAGETLLYGADFQLRLHDGGHEDDEDLLTVEGEVMARRFLAAAQVDANDPLDPNDDVLLPEETLEDWGCYLQAVWSFSPRWSCGLRGEWATGSGASYDAGTDRFDRAGDPFRGDRVRVSTMLGYSPGASSRLRLQYNFDRADHLEDDAHSVWLGFEVSIGGRAPHRH